LVILKGVILGFLTLLPTIGLQAFTAGNGTQANPYVIDASDKTMDAGDAYYLANSSINFGLSPDFFGAYTIIYVGYHATNNQLRISGTDTTVTAYTSYVGFSSGSSGSVLVTDGAAWKNSTIVGIGANGSGDLTVENGGSISSTTATIGMNAGDHASTATVTGSGSFWKNTGDMWVGLHNTGSLTVKNGALVVVNGLLSTGTDGTTYIAGGYIAKKGQATTSGITNLCYIKVYDGANWVAGTAANLTATYYDGTTNVWSATDLYKTYGDKIDLTGYTVITGGQSLFAWADTNVSEADWNDSSWYGWFYADTTTFGNWIWHAAHGWQYVASGSTSGATYVWDNATQDWWFTSGTYYPYIYDYSTASWYYYVSGATPNRVLWSYSANKSVSEGTGF